MHPRRIDPLIGALDDKVVIGPMNRGGLHGLTSLASQGLMAMVGSFLWQWVPGQSGQTI